MKSIIIYTFVAYLALVNSTTAQTQLAYNLNVGDQFTVQQVAHQDIVQEMEGTKHEMKNVLEGDFTFTVEDVSDSIYGIIFKFDRFKMFSSSNLVGELININTNDSITSDDIQGQIFAQLVNTDLRMKMYKTGKIKSIEGSKQLIDNMINNSGDFDDFTKALMKESMSNEFSNESLAKSFEQMIFIYSPDRINKGDSWTNNFEGELSSENTWTLESINNDDVTINGSSTIIFVNQDEDVEMRLSGDMTSNLITSLETGFVKTMTTQSVAKGHSIMHNMNGMKVPTSISSNITYKIEKHVQ